MNIRKNSTKGFTIVEVMVTVVISAFVLTSAYAAIISLAKGSESMINYSEMNGQTRLALEIFGRDARAAKNVNVFTENLFVMRRGTSFTDLRPNVQEDHFVIYEFVPQAGTFTREVYSIDPTEVTNTYVKKMNQLSASEIRNNLTEVSNEVLLFDVDDLNFIYYRLVDPEVTGEDPIAKTTPEVKHVQLEARLERRVLNLTNTNYIISARFMMRNKDVGE